METEANQPSSSEGVGRSALPRGRIARARAWLSAAWRNPAYRFAALFLLYLGVIGFAYPALRTYFREVGNAMSTGTAQLEYYLFKLFGTDVSVSDTTLTFGGFAVQVIEECTAIYEVLIFSAAVLAFQTSWSKKAVGLALGLPLLYAINLFRIAVLMVVGRYYASVFDFMHLYFWQATLILMITSVWLLWIFKVVQRDEETLPARS